MADVLMIGRYQLENLLKQQIQFYYFDLSESVAHGTSRHALLARSQVISPDQVLAQLRTLGAPPEAPIVLVCENGSKSVALAQVLEENSFRNVYVVRDGVRGLDDE